MRRDVRVWASSPLLVAVFLILIPGGVAWRGGELLDPGRFTVTRKNKDRAAFKTATLRNVERTAPYMHDGSLKTLEEVIEFYDRGGNANSSLDPAVRPLHLTLEEKAAIVAFLRSLTGSVQEGLAAVPPDPSYRKHRRDARHDPNMRLAFPGIKRRLRAPAPG